MRKPEFSLLCVLLASLMLTGCPAFFSSDDSDSESTPTNQHNPGSNPHNAMGVSQEVFMLVNVEREKVSRSPLQWCDGLATHAWCHTFDMCDRGFLSHVNPEGEDPSKRAQRAHAGNYQFSQAPYGIDYPIVPDPYPWIGENIAQGQQTPAAVMDMWMHSVGDWFNILDSTYTHIGVGVCDCSTRHWCMNFSYR